MESPRIPADSLDVEGRLVLVRYVRHDRARRYRLTLLRDGSARCTVPRRGSMAEARRFVERCRPWLTRQLAARSAEPRSPAGWRVGSRIWFRGAETELILVAPGLLRLGDFEFKARLSEDPDLRPVVERAFLLLAKRELPARVEAAAARHGFKVTRVSVRNQRSRWGSCSRRGVVSLNWRLVQAPEFVCDYIILHELAHLRHMNHSERFWAEVRCLSPEFENAEAWLRQHGRRLL